MPGSYALDEVLGFDGRYSKVVQKHISRLAADGSFASTQEHLREMLNVRVGEETIRSIAHAHGRAMSRFQLQDEATAEAFRAAPGEVEIAIDAGKVHTREEGWKDLKIAVISKRESGEGVSPSGWEDQRLPKANVVVAFAMIATSKKFHRFWPVWLRFLGVSCFGAVHALGDGASWIWKSVNRVLTGCGQTLDFFHGCERLMHAAKAIFGEGTAEARNAYHRGRSLLLEQGWPGVCTWVGELLSVEDAKEQTRRQKITEKLVGYFSKHLSRLNYAERLAAGRAIGSGAVEGQAKTLGLRLKARGARWRKSNVRPMASLVCVRNSSQWAKYWANAT